MLLYLYVMISVRGRRGSWGAGGWGGDGGGQMASGVSKIRSEIDKDVEMFVFDTRSKIRIYTCCLYKTICISITCHAHIYIYIYIYKYMYVYIYIDR